jgi:hypothetical protein
MPPGKVGSGSERAKKERPSFLKKRSKKLLLLCDWLREKAF